MRHGPTYLRSLSRGSGLEIAVLLEDVLLPHPAQTEGRSLTSRKTLNAGFFDVKKP